MNFTLARVTGAQNSTKSEFRYPAGNVIEPALERGEEMALHPRIPAGTFPLLFRTLPSKFDGSFRTLLGADFHGVIVIGDVPGRSNIEIHTANSWTELEGCVAPGMTVVEGPDGEFAVPGGQSSPAFKTVYMALAAAILAGPTTLTVVDEDAPAPMVS